MIGFVEVWVRGAAGVFLGGFVDWAEVVSYAVVEGVVGLEGVGEGVEGFDWGSRGAVFSISNAEAFGEAAGLACWFEGWGGGGEGAAGVYLVGVSA